MVAVEHQNGIVAGALREDGDESIRCKVLLQASAIVSWIEVPRRRASGLRLLLRVALELLVVVGRSSVAFSIFSMSLSTGLLSASSITVPPSVAAGGGGGEGL